MPITRGGTSLGSGSKARAKFKAGSKPKLEKPGFKKLKVGSGLRFSVFIKEKLGLD